MAIRENAFSPEKALESVLFIASLLTDPDVHEVLKMRYFADKIHFSEYGFMGSGDRYVAMYFGPVPSSTYDLLKVARGDMNGFTDPRFIALVEGSLVVERGGKNKIKPQRVANLEYLSKADVDSIRQAVETYGNKSFDERTDISHDSAWEAAWNTAKENDWRQSPMHLESIAKTLDNSEEVITYLHAQGMNFFASTPGFLRTQFQRQLVPGAVIKLAEKMDDGKIQEKRFVVANVTDKTFCCVINSKVNPFIQSKPARLRCQVLMLKADHAFMSWDSHVDCTNAKAYNTNHVLNELMNKTGLMLGSITLTLRDDMISALKFSPALSPKEVSDLCAALQAMEQ